jgi:hypothetical protein
MKTATGLTLIAVGAILTFAVTAHPRFLNLQVVGVVLMATGAAGLFMPRRAQGWLRRRIVVRRDSRGPVLSEINETLPPYVMINSAASADGRDPQPGIPLERTVVDLPIDEQITERTVPADPARTAGSEVVDEYLEE